MQNITATILPEAQMEVLWISLQSDWLVLSNPVCVCDTEVPGGVLDLGLTRVHPGEDADVEVGADAEEGLDVALVHPRPLVQTVQDDPQSLEKTRRHVSVNTLHKNKHTQKQHTSQKQNTQKHTAQKHTHTYTHRNNTTQTQHTCTCTETPHRRKTNTHKNTTLHKNKHTHKRTETAL